MTLLRLATANIQRTASRSIAAALAAGLASALAFAAVAILQSVEGTLQSGVQRLGADLMVVPAGHRAAASRLLIAGEPSDFYMNEAVVRRVAQLDGIEVASPQLFVTSAELMCCSTPRVLLVGIDPETDFTIAPWKRHIHSPSQDGAAPVIVGANTLYAVEGTYMTFFGKLFKMLSSIQPTGLGFLDDSVFMTIEDARDMIRVSAERAFHALAVAPDQISCVLVRARRGTDIAALAEEVARAVPDAQVVRIPDLTATVRRDVRASIWGVVVAGGVSWLMTLLVVGLAFSLSVNERRREIGLFRAMGATRSQVAGLLLTEAVVVTATGSLAGLLVGWLIVSRHFDAASGTLGPIPFLPPPAAHFAMLALLCVVGVVASAALAALLPVIRSARMDPYDAIRGTR